MKYDTSEPTDFLNTEYKKIRIDTSKYNWHKILDTLVINGWLAETKNYAQVEWERFLFNHKSKNVLNIDCVYMLTFSRSK